MNKKVAIWVVVILIIALLIGGVIMFLDDENSGANPSISGDVNLQISGDNNDKPQKGDIDYVDPVEEYVINGLLANGTLNNFAETQIIKLDEVAMREYFWTMEAEGLENISIDSGETELVSFEHGVGEIVNRLYKITGVKEGNAILRFNATYKQSPELDPIQSETIIYKISVNENKLVAITEETRFIPIEAVYGHQAHQ